MYCYRKPWAPSDPLAYVKDVWSSAFKSDGERSMISFDISNASAVYDTKLSQQNVSHLHAL